MSESKLSLKNLLVPSKAVSVEYPGMPGFELNLNFLSKETIIGLRKKSMSTKFKRGGQVEEEVNDDLFTELYVKAVLKGWKGLKMKYVEQLVPVDMTGVNPEDELAYNDENALMLMKNSTDFDQYVGGQVSDLANFTSAKKSS